MRKSEREQIIAIQSNQQMVYQYFNLITEKDIEGLLDLFADDARVYEPFSNMPNGISGKSELQHFFKVVVMANSGMNRKSIEFVEDRNAGKGDNSSSITAFVTYERGDTIKSRLDFHFAIEGKLGKKIKTLRIQFLE